MKTNPLVAYSTLIALKLHFEQGSYDAFKYHFKGPRQKSSTFLKSKDKYHYEKIAKQYPKLEDLVYFYLANILVGNTWIRDMEDEAYFLWQAKMQRMNYQFNIDMTTAFDYATNHGLTFDDLLKDTSGRIAILDLLRNGRIQEESVIIIDNLVKFLSNINKNTIHDPLNLLSDMVYKLQQYKPFIVPRINKAATRNVIVNLFS